MCGLCQPREERKKISKQRDPRLAPACLCPFLEDLVSTAVDARGMNMEKGASKPISCNQGRWLKGQIHPDSITQGSPIASRSDRSIVNAEHPTTWAEIQSAATPAFFVLCFCSLASPPHDMETTCDVLIYRCTPCFPLSARAAARTSIERVHRSRFWGAARVSILIERWDLGPLGPSTRARARPIIVIESALARVDTTRACVPPTPIPVPKSIDFS